MCHFFCALFHNINIGRLAYSVLNLMIYFPVRKRGVSFSFLLNCLRYLSILKATHTEPFPAIPVCYKSQCGH